MKAHRLAVAVACVSASLLPLMNADAASVAAANALALPPGNVGLSQGYLPFQSCPSLGNCTVAGAYLTSRGDTAAFADSEVKGVWQAPVALTPPNGYQAKHGVITTALACPTVGTCVVLGQYSTSNNTLAFVDSQTNGIWQKSAALNVPSNVASSGATVTANSVTCMSAGNCTVVATYSTGKSVVTTEGYVISEVRGTWGHPLEISLPAGANSNPDVTLTQIACWNGGDCAASGSYVDTDNVSHAVVISEVSGSWKKALSVALPGNASAFAGAQFDEIACANNGDCMATGTFNTITGAVQPLVALSHSYAWARAVEVNVPRAAANPETTVFGFQGSSCAASGDCAFGGQFRDKSGLFQGFLVNVVNGNVQRAQVLDLPAGAQQAGRNGGVVSVSCPAIGACVAGATYLNAKKQYEPLVAHETKNVWTLGTTVVLPDGASSVGVDGGVYSVRCFSSSSCAVSGSYLSASRYEGFALTLSP